MIIKVNMTSFFGSGHLVGGGAEARVYGRDVRFPDSSYVTGPHGEFGILPRAPIPLPLPKKPLKFCPLLKMAERESSDDLKGRV